MSYTIAEVTRFIEENDVKFIRLAFCDLYGKQKNISIMPSELTKAFDTGICFDPSAVSGFALDAQRELFLVPDPSTLSVLPWRPSHGRVVRFFCNMKRRDGTWYEPYWRSLYEKSVRKLQNYGLHCKIGTNCEFYLFDLDERGAPTRNAQDTAGYGDIAPRDKGENVRRDICLTLEEMGIYPESSHHERGPGQNEIDFKHSDASSAADNFLAFKGVVKSIAARNGLYASFMPRPYLENSGSGLHLNLSLYSEAPGTKQSNPSKKAFFAGMINRLKELSLFLNPLNNSYLRFTKGDVPSQISWSSQNNGQIITISAPEDEVSRFSLRSPDASLNPYLAFSLLLEAGMEGMEQNLPLCAPVDLPLNDLTPDQRQQLPHLCKNLGEAVDAAEQSEFLAKNLPAELLREWIQAKRKEFEEYSRCEEKENWELAAYFLSE